MTKNRFLLSVFAAIIVIMAAILIWLAWPDNSANSNLDNPESTDSPSLPQSQADNKSPDRVKASGAPSGDTVPSSSGTGPGPENSFLSQP